MKKKASKSKKQQNALRLAPLNQADRADQKENKAARSLDIGLDAWLKKNWMD